MTDTLMHGKGRPASSPATEFGKYLLELMASRKIEGGSSGLARTLTDERYSISQQTISSILSGNSKASRKFALRVTRVLNLTREERRRLSWLLLYGQGDAVEVRAE
jgi:hypothetical protein